MYHGLLNLKRNKISKDNGNILQVAAKLLQWLLKIFQIQSLCRLRFVSPMVVASVHEETKRASGSVELVILAVLMSHLTNKMDKQWHDWKPAMKYSG